MMIARTNTTTTGDAETAPIAVSVTEARRLIGLGRSTIYRLFDAGRLPRIKVGGRTLIPYDSLRALATAASAT